MLAELFEIDVADINQNDGLKIIFENNDWVLCRPSGTEPLIRLYESADETKQKYIEKIKYLLIESSIE